MQVSAQLAHSFPHAANTSTCLNGGTRNWFLTPVPLPKSSTEKYQHFALISNRHARRAAARRTIDLEGTRAQCDKSNSPFRFASERIFAEMSRASFILVRSEKPIHNY